VGNTEKTRGFFEKKLSGKNGLLMQTYEIRTNGRAGGEINEAPLGRSPFRANGSFRAWASWAGASALCWQGTVLGWKNLQQLFGDY